MKTTNGIVHNKSIQILTYVDNLDIISRSKQAVTESFVAIQTEAEKIGLIINEEETKFMIVSSQQTNNSPLVMNGLTFENVTKFKYNLEQLSPIETK